MNVFDKLKEISDAFKNAGIEDSAKEAEILITETLHIDKSKLYADSLEISDETSKHIDSLAERRLQGEPIQYIIGHVDFYGLKINVGRGVLIPRPETELVVEEAIKQLKLFKVHGSRLTVLDLCTGSGCIALAIAKEFPDAKVYAVDRSDEALKYSRENASQNNIENVCFIKGDLFNPVKGLVFDLIVSNPPYIKKSGIKSLQKEIRDYEPIDALDGGEDGLDFYRRILRESPYFLKKDSFLILEIGHDQADDVKDIAIDYGFKDINFMQDYSGIRRIFIGHI